MTRVTLQRRTLRLTTDQRLETTEAGSEGAPYSSACEHVAHILIWLQQSHFLDCSVHAYCWLALRYDMAKEFQFFWIIIIDTVKAKIVFVFG